ncbi:MAG: malto-oligosyltrehalose synthase [Deltaproteobacteria bacterium]|nr:malto-oligosyltrehalose synthase [Deltaproteobacteria bacterium]
MRIPTATYRLQLHKGFGFKALQEILSYLAELGISDVYASPIFRVREGSLHGYDIVNQGELNPELGDPLDFEDLMEEIRKRDMGWLQDIVPNHMAFDAQNEMLWDVLENGSRSPYFEFFDVWWDHPYTGMKGRLLAPFLGTFYGESLEAGEIRILYDQKGFSINYYDLFFPLRIESYTHLLTHGLEGLKKKLGRNHLDFVKLLGILYVLRTLSSQEGDDEGYEQIAFIKNTLWEIYTRCDEIRAFIDENLRLFNGAHDPRERARCLDFLLSEQMFRLSFWKVATEEINYRRFFSINDLISLRVEREDVFNRVHALIFKLAGEGKITGLRVDHIDGLYDPKLYLDRLRDAGKGLYTVVEKILDREELLPMEWSVEGTTGYDFLNALNGVFCNKDSAKAFSKGYSSFTGLNRELEELVYEKKRLILEKHMTGDVDNLAHQLKNISSEDRYGSDITLYGLKRALTEVMASFPVYRTYVRAERVREEDRAYINEAVETARKRNSGLSHELDFVERFLLLRSEGELSEEEKTERLRFVMRFQQFTGPLMAKGFEDTALYVYNRLLSLNEVGGSPGHFGLSADLFHNFNMMRVKHRPHTLSATSTHDTKRGEDTRARLNALSEIPEEWERLVKAWSRVNRTKRKNVKGSNVPDKNDEYFFYQTLVGAMPFEEKAFPEFVSRIKAYIIKAVREAKVHTAWLKPDGDYEEGFLSFIDEILKPGHPFLKEFMPFQKRIAGCSLYTSLSQVLIKITAPGVPDFYQGSELWDLSLVDPDNRRPVNYEIRKNFLTALKRKAGNNLSSLIRELLRTKEDGRIKLFLIERALKARRENMRLFQEGDYAPLEADGLLRKHIIAFARRREGKWAVTVAPRFFAALTLEGALPLGEKTWKDTGVLFPEGAPEQWGNVLTGETIGGRGRMPVADILKAFPAALLVSRADPQ